VTQLYTCSDGIHRTIEDIAILTERGIKVSIICEYNPEKRKHKEKGKKRTTHYHNKVPRVFFGRGWKK